MADAAATPVVTFPDDYPNSVRHFLLIGFLGMFIGSIVFFYMGISRKVNTISHVLTFFMAAVASCSYYAMWAGLGVEYKTTDTTPRVIFWARYLDWVITLPVNAPSPSLQDRNAPGESVPLGWAPSDGMLAEWPWLALASRSVAPAMARRRRFGASGRDRTDVSAHLAKRVDGASSGRGHADQELHSRWMSAKTEWSAAGGSA